jgi:NAD(P)-dependent dehydrogenase (short-subunit alcohol dehydrogenase family)
LRSRKLLFLTGRPERFVELERTGALAGLNFQVLGPMESEERLAASLDRLSGSFDTIIAVQSLDDSTGSSILADRYPALPDLLFAVCKHAYTSIESQQIWVASVSLNAFRSGHLDPHTGLTAGFLKALARELPQSACRIVNTDESTLSTALRQLEAEFGRPSDGSEICYRSGKRHSIALSKVERLADGSKPALDASSVVLATGGGRGVTAVLAEELLNRFGCTVIALGRTDPASAPPHILAMDEAQLVEYESQFYKEQIARGTGKKIIELKKEYKNYQSVLEVNQTVRRLSALPGRFEYVSADLTNGLSVAAAVESVFQKYGRVDLVLHGAGIQVSKVLPKKSLRDFQNVLSAKLESLRFIYQACQKHAGGRATGYHILTSAFSYMGNDGQEDYGAANETLNRLAAVMDDSPRGGPWTSVAWLGWAGIGMTRGLEYAALAAHRGLRGVTKEEGQKIFSELLNGRASTPINVILAAGELEFYKVKTVKSMDAMSPPAVSAPSPALARKDSMVIEREVNAETAPYVWDHLVDGIPTMPGVLLIILIAEAALELRPNLKITSFEDAAFRRFVRMRREGNTPFRLHASVISEDADSTVVRVAILADFVHKNGTVLRKDVEQTAVSVRLAPAVAEAPKNGNAARPARKRFDGLSLEDPYLMDGSPVKLGGPFRSMQNILAGSAERSADYRLREDGRPLSGYRYLNLIMLDALVRFGGIYQDGQAFPIYVPEACRTIKIYYDFTNPDEKTFTGSLKFAGSNPQLDADRLTIGPVEARDPAGRMLVMVDGGLCRKMGEARNGK